jgi:hypothetical protein
LFDTVSLRREDLRQTVFCFAVGGVDIGRRDDDVETPPFRFEAHAQRGAGGRHDHYGARERRCRAVEIAHPLAVEALVETTGLVLRFDFRDEFADAIRRCGPALQP